MSFTVFVDACGADSAYSAVKRVDWQAQWLTALGYSEPLPFAAYRKQHWQSSPPFPICLSVLSVEVQQRALMVKAIDDDLMLNEDQWHTLKALLQPLFKSEIRLHPSGFYLLQEEVLITPPISAYSSLASQRQFHCQQPGWARLLCECQMALKNSDFNQRRLSNGQLTVDALWPWGGCGEMAAMVNHPTVVSDHSERFPFDVVPLDEWLSCRAARESKTILIHLEQPSDARLSAVERHLRSHRVDWVWHQQAYSRIPSLWRRLFHWS